MHEYGVWCKEAEKVAIRKGEVETIKSYKWQRLKIVLVERRLLLVVKQIREPHQQAACFLKSKCSIKHAVSSTFKCYFSSTVITEMVFHEVTVTYGRIRPKKHGNFYSTKDILI